jgi:PAS fold.
VNQRWSEITGLNAEIAAESGWMNAIHPDDAERVKMNGIEQLLRKFLLNQNTAFSVQTVV